MTACLPVNTLDHVLTPIQRQENVVSHGVEQRTKVGAPHGPHDQPHSLLVVHHATLGATGNGADDETDASGAELIATQRCLTEWPYSR